MPTIFPQVSSELINNISINRRNPGYGRSPVFNFETGEFRTIDGKVYIAEGIEVLKNWVEKVLRTERYRFPIYSSDYGVTLEEMAVRNLPYTALTNELKEQISEALLQDVRISKVDNFKFIKERDYLEIQFEIETFDRKTVTMEVQV